MKQILLIVGVVILAIFIVYISRKTIINWIKDKRNKVGQVIEGSFPASPFGFWHFFSNAKYQLQEAENRRQKSEEKRIRWETNNRQGWESLHKLWGKETFDEDDLNQLWATIKKDQKKIAELLELQRHAKNEDEYNLHEEMIKKLQERLAKNRPAHIEMRRIFTDNHISGIDIAEAEALVEKRQDQLKALEVLSLYWTFWFIATILLSCIVASPVLLLSTKLGWYGFLAITTVIFLAINGYTLKKNYMTVPQAEEYVMELFNRYITTWDPGLHFKFPFFMSLREEVFMADWGTTLYMHEGEWEGMKSTMVEFMDAESEIYAELFFRIFSAKSATYNIDNVKKSIREKMESGIRAYYGAKKIDDAISERGDVDLRQIITLEATEAGIFKRWGVKIVSLAIKDIGVPKEVEDQRRRRLTAQKDFEVAEINLKTADVVARTRKQEGVGIGDRLLEIKKAAGEGASIDSVINYDLVTKRYEAYQRAGLLIASDEGQTPAKSGAIAGAAALIAAKQVDKIQTKKKTDDEKE